ncbi:hypothetical protein [Halobacterium noricense]|uniref:hypothetical protein n=1 Tax=Halobacterium noricense TaxID=223182 RepID=UPI001E3EF5E4|nr:hypothetical protein [Halobacterium noricense]UHH24290.1 hypothetical protein LT974_09850 [Halobacterium noricense]
MSVDEREEVLRSSSEGLRETLRNQLAAHRNVNQRAIDLVKIGLLAASIAVSDISLSGVVAVVPYLAAATVGFLCEYLTEASLFGDAVWASVAGVLFTSVAAGCVVATPPLALVPVVYAAVPAACLWGKERYGFPTNTEP